ncbi:unnamed protein product [Paramecium primaurelia]|uniref:Uncharacterized protein n=2 Tax=Paramecium TaxID=5884 RepID=A0A8S1XYI3_9CILI|nr:unnamed protein product [Paramecium primaurelia]CAD8206703.1 unnamed protein product [Paramecium pentaurelia]
MQDSLNSSLDSLELEIFHKPNTQIKSILEYLRNQKLQFCTDPKKKQDNYYSSSTESLDSFSLKKNKFFQKYKSSTSIENHEN